MHFQRAFLPCPSTYLVIVVTASFVHVFQSAEFRYLIHSLDCPVVGRVIHCATYPPVNKRILFVLFPTFFTWVQCVDSEKNRVRFWFSAFTGYLQIIS